MRFSQYCPILFSRLVSWAARARGNEGSVANDGGADERTGGGGGATAGGSALAGSAGRAETTSAGCADAGTPRRCSRINMRSVSEAIWALSASSSSCGLAIADKLIEQLAISNDEEFGNCVTW
jgi:hypothetical protein